MLVSSRTPMRWPRPDRTTVAVAALLLLLVGCSGEDEPPQPPVEPIVQATPLADYDTSGLTLVRDDFCGRVDEGAITSALGGDATADESWQPGRRLPGSKEISNEFGCTWSRDGISASAWVFAVPANRQRAANYARETVAKSCSHLEDAPDLGRPSVAQRCTEPVERVAISGLIGDSWVGCEVSGRPSAVDGGTDHVGEWCVAVLEALRTT